MEDVAIISCKQLDFQANLKEIREENVTNEISQPRYLKIRNLLSMEKDLKSTPRSLRNSPDIDRPVYFAIQNDLKDFFKIIKENKNVGYLGRIEGGFIRAKQA